ncbi:hypothetical protein DVU_2180 [Nitratidesulfovibrio vulgaris str. Hildenborough]|uniref:Uncharacterized protein n=1 Tax=Nitratidesulfovibrio vulgaris (strain ATCC 29579 / DSM 644 / CCUG 34227 / NCIMB 8303 / VKM B-1760 / Hildenborough) TaxID=882 RepID=Q72A17_NITV2|nr:hypothetical protein DVU_2180 [Nitratidesulfovibrio vulgaris str. Hildenborough]
MLPLGAQNTFIGGLPPDRLAFSFAYRIGISAPICRVWAKYNTRKGK